MLLLARIARTAMRAATTRPTTPTYGDVLGAPGLVRERGRFMAARLEPRHAALRAS